MSIEEVDHIYYNFLLYNNQNTNQPASFSEDRQDAILKKGNEFEVTVARFSIPTVTVPLFIWRPNIYYIGLSVNGGDIYWKEINLVINNVFTSTGTVYGDPYDPNFVRKDLLSVYSYQVWIDSINSAFTRLWKAHPDANQGNAPEVVYHSNTDVSIIADVDQNGNKLWPNYLSGTDNPTPGDPNSFQIFMSRQLYLQFFPSFDADQIHSNTIPLNTPPVGLTEGNDLFLNYRLRFVETKINIFTIPTEKRERYPNLGNGIYYELNSQYPPTFAWTKVKRLILASNALQINNEFIGARNKEGVADGSPYAQSMLTDFEIPIDDHPLNRHTVYYQPAVFRWTSIITSSEVRKLDIRILYQEYDSLEVFPLMLPPHHECSIKLLFRRKPVLPKLILRLLKHFQEEHSKDDDIQLTSQYRDKSTNDSGFRLQGGFVGIQRSIVN